MLTDAVKRDGSGTFALEDLPFVVGLRAGALDKIMSMDEFLVACDLTPGNKYEKTDDGSKNMTLIRPAH